MFKRNLIISFIICNAINYLTCISVISENQNMIISLSGKLNARHIIIIKDFNFQSGHHIFHFTKNLSKMRISTSFLFPDQMNKSMWEYYKTPSKYFQDQNRKFLPDLYKKRDYLVYPPKTLAIITGEKIITQLFEVFKKL